MRKPRACDDGRRSGSNRAVCVCTAGKLDVVDKYVSALRAFAKAHDDAMKAGTVSSSSGLKSCCCDHESAYRQVKADNTDVARVV